MKRYFLAECDDEGQPIEENIVEISPPYGIPFAVGILLGVIVTLLVA